VKVRIEKCMALTQMILRNRTTRCSVKIGHLGQNGEDLVENVEAILKVMKEKLPGGWKNIRSLYLSAGKSPLLPIYASFESSNLVRMEPAKKKRDRPVEGELTTLDEEFGDAKVRVFPDGRVEIIEADGTTVKLPKENEKLKNKRKRQRAESNSRTEASVTSSVKREAK